MSFVHASIVGHFDPSNLASIHPNRSPVPVKVIDRSRAVHLLASFGPDVARCVTFENGYVWCEWSLDLSARVRDFADRLADQEGAIILETPGGVRYPPEAIQLFQEAINTWSASRDRFSLAVGAGQILSRLVHDRDVTEA